MERDGGKFGLVELLIKKLELSQAKSENKNIAILQRIIKEQKKFGNPNNLIITDTQLALLKERHTEFVSNPNFLNELGIDAKQILTIQKCMKEFSKADTFSLIIYINNPQNTVNSIIKDFANIL